MKRIFLFFLIIFSAQLFSQGVVNNLVVFSNEGLKFTLIMNGERYNMTPETKVRVTNLTLKKYQVKIIFEDSYYKEHNTTLTFFSTGRECQFALNRKGKRKHTMDYFTESAMPGWEQPAQNLNNNTTTPVQQNNTNQNIQNNTPPPPATEPSTIITGPGTVPKNPNGVHINENGTITIGNEQFNIFKNDILKEVSDIAKQRKAQELFKNSWLLTSQVKETMKTMNTEQAKLDFAKLSYKNTKDKENYSQLLELLTVISLKEDLKKFIESQK